MPPCRTRRYEIAPGYARISAASASGGRRSQPPSGKGVSELGKAGFDHGRCLIAAFLLVVGIRRLASSTKAVTVPRTIPTIQRAISRSFLGASYRLLRGCVLVLSLTASSSGALRKSLGTMLHTGREKAGHRPSVDEERRPPIGS